jgi:lipoprotein signal peptidase
MKHRRRAGFYLAGLVLLADQAAKFAVLHNDQLASGALITLLPVLNLVLVWNHGITFGLFAGAGAKYLLAALAAAVILALSIWLWRAKTWIETLAIGAIAGGAIGNVLDRLNYGAVVDFLQMHAGPLFFPWIFNVGDSAICCGVAALIARNIFAGRAVAASNGGR